MSPEPETELDALRRALVSGRWEDRRDALKALLARPDVDPLPLLLDAVQDRAKGLRRVALEALRQRAAEAVPELRRRLASPTRGPLAAALLACSADGRRALADRHDRGGGPLCEALELPDLSVRIKLQVVKALVICSGDEVGDHLTKLLAHPSPMLKNVAGRALCARWDARAVPWLCIALSQFSMQQPVLIEWLGEQRDPTALPVLKRLASLWRNPFALPEVRQAARRALTRLDADLRQVPTGALSRASVSGPSEAALSLWREEETAEEQAAE